MNAKGEKFYAVKPLSLFFVTELHMYVAHIQSEHDKWMFVSGRDWWKMNERKEENSSKSIYR